MRTLSHVFFLDPSPVRRVPIQTGIQRKLNFVSVRTIKGSSSADRKKVRAGGKPKQAGFQSADGPRETRELKDRVRRIFVPARVAKGQMYH